MKKNLPKIHNITDMIPKHAMKVNELPKGKPTHRVAYTQGPARTITYIFKNRSVYLRISFKRINHYYLLDNSIIDDKGDLLRA